MEIIRDAMVAIKWKCITYNGRLMIAIIILEDGK